MIYIVCTSASAKPARDFYTESPNAVYKNDKVKVISDASSARGVDFTKADKIILYAKFWQTLGWDGLVEMFRSVPSYKFEVNFN
jgi:hypothetical protein